MKRARNISVRACAAPWAMTWALAALWSCGGKEKVQPPQTEKPGPAGVVLVQKDTPEGLSLRLRDGSPSGDSAGKVERIPPAKATPLPDREAERLLARLPALASQGAAKDFALPARTMPAPRPGETVSTPFPPAATPPPPEAGAAGDGAAGQALSVIRRAPEGDVPLAPHLSVTFSQPMVAVTGQADAARSVPVTISPMPQGKWRWLGTRTLLFEPEPRFPQATEYKVSIAAGIQSATGQTLGKEQSWTFVTPPPRMLQSWPSGESQPRVPAMFVGFDQQIDAQAVLSTIRVTAGSKRYALRLLTPDEIAASPEVQNLIDASEKGRYVAFGVEEPLPAGTRVTVDVGPGTPSAEGPRTTQEAQSFWFETFRPLDVEESACGWGDQCRPLMPWYIRLNNQLDDKHFDPARIQVAPALPGAIIEGFGDTIQIRGASKGRTTYTVTLPAELTDVHGQTLGTSKQVTFQVGDADPRLHGPEGLVVLDPAAREPKLSVFTTNVPELSVRLYRVGPGDWPAYQQYVQTQHERTATPPGRKVVDSKIKVKGAADELVETAIDLAPVLEGKLGHVLAVVEPTSWKEDHYRPRVQSWIQATRIGLDAFVDSTELVAWATRLEDGTPLEGVALELMSLRPGSSSGSSDAQGMARLPLPPGPQGAHALVARMGDDTAILPESNGWWGGGFVKQTLGDALLWYVFDDRQMYKPGERVSVKGWVRRMDRGENGDLVPLQGAVTSMSYRFQGPRGEDLAKGQAKVNALGGFHLELTVPQGANLGWANLELTAGGTGAVDSRTFYHGLQIQEFRRPEFEVSAAASQGPHMVGSSAQVTAEARYYAGGGLGNAPVSWRVTASEGTFTPPGWDEFIFGVWRPWWFFGHEGGGGFGGRGFAKHGREPGGSGIWPPFGAPLNTYEHQAQTDATGKHVLQMDFLAATPPRPMQVAAEATITDVNRQAWTASAQLLVHPSALYVGLRRTAMFVDRGKPIELQAIAVDHDGKAVAGRPVVVRAERLVWSMGKGEQAVDTQECAVTSAAQPVTCTFKTEQGGQYRITAKVSDEQDRPSESQLSVWVAGEVRPPSRSVEREEVVLIPDKPSYQPGDTARILVQAPFSPAQGLLTVRRSGIVDTRRFDLDGTSTTLEIPISETHIPNVHVQVDLVGSAARVDENGKLAANLPRRPAFAGATLDLSVPPLRRTLAVELAPQARTLAPGGTTRLDVRVRDAAGQPVPGAEVAVVVVDEAILSLSNYKLADPLELFYLRRDSGTRDYYLRQHVELARPEPVLAQAEAPPPPPAPPMEAAAAPGGGGAAMEREEAPAADMAVARRKSRGGAFGANAAGNAPIALRTNFAALAVFAPEVRTSPDGNASIDVTVPDNLTRYRVMAVAVHGDRFFGKAESSITARKPVMVRPSPPRFLRFGDTFELPVVVQNQTDQPVSVAVAVRAANARMTAGLGRTLSVAANDRVEVRFPAAAELAGTARFQIVASAGKDTDAAELALPVYTPATAEAFATYGEIDADAAISQPVAVPTGVTPAFGGLEITTSSTQLQALTDALLYLVAYPFECAEQISSRVLAVAALRDVLTAFEAEGLPPPAELQAATGRDLERLATLQNADGGFGFWRAGERSEPYVSIHVAHALHRAQKKGLATASEPALQRAAEYLRNIEANIPGWYGPEIRNTLIAYALYVRSLMGDADRNRARKLLKDVGLDKLSLEAVGWLLGTLAGDSGSQSQREAILRHLTNRVAETAGAAHFATSYGDSAYLLLHSERRADAVILESLIAEQPKSDLIPKLVRGLLNHRKAGRWENTQENVFVLLALDRYFHTYEAVTPSLVARMWLGTRFAGEHRYQGRSTHSQHVDIPMSYLVGPAAKTGLDLLLQKTGAGRLYYRIGMRYAPADHELKPADYGFAVERSYEAVDDPKDVVRRDDGTWQIEAGARVRVRLRMVAPARRYHVALVDPLPAGLEPLNPALAVTGEIPEDPAESKQAGAYWWWMRTWYEHQNLRDERAEAFASLLWDGVHEYTYVARATTPGQFIVPPAHAEEMYEPETFGRSASTRVTVVE